jgi:hypothetical protein
MAEREGDIAPALTRLAESPLLRRLRVWFFPLVVKVDPRTHGLAQASVLAITDIAKTVMAGYEQQPDVVVDEAAFLAELKWLIDEGYGVPGPEPRTAPLPARNTPPARDTPPARHAAAVPVVPDTQPRPSPRPRAAPPPVRPTATAPVPATRARSLREPVVHTGADMVFVQERSPWQRLRGPAPTDADSIAQLAGLTGAVSLAYLVFVPDDENQSREVTKRRRATALELDKLLGAVVADAETRRPTKVAVEVLSATSPLRKHGALAPAGELTDGDLPRVPIEMFDVFDTADSLLEAMQRSTRSLAARDVKVLSRHLVFLAAVPLRDTNATGQEWDRLLRRARITWVHFGPAQPSFTELQRPSPFGVHLLTDKDDVAALFRRESEVLYRWPAPAAVVEATRDPGEEPPAAKGRRWWPRRRSTPPG